MTRLGNALFVLGAFVSFASWGADESTVRFVTFPAADHVSQVDHLVVTVSCSWVASLKAIPELQDIRMGYEISSVNVLEASPRLGAAAVTLSRWNGVIGIHLPTDADARSCFDVTVSVEDRDGVTHKWTASQLGISTSKR